MAKKTTAETLAGVSTNIAAALPVLRAAFGALNLVKEMFRRREAGEPVLTLAEEAQLIEDGAQELIADRDAWFDANPGFDRSTGEKIK